MHGITESYLHLAHPEKKKKPFENLLVMINFQEYLQSEKCCFMASYWSWLLCQIEALGSCGWKDVE